MKKLLTKLGIAGVLALAGCDSKPEIDRTVVEGKLKSGMRYHTYVAPRSGFYEGERVISFCDGLNVKTFEYKGNEDVAGNYLQKYDITLDGKLVMEDGEFNAYTTSPQSNTEHWKKIAIGSSRLRQEAIKNANEVFPQLGINRLLKEGSPDITTARNRQDKLK